MARYSCLLILLLALACQAAGQRRRRSHAPEPTPTVADPEFVRGLPPACNCTDIGISGNVDVDGRVGCWQHLLYTNNDPTWFCYIVDPATCIAASASDQFPGASYRGCNPDVDITLEEAEGLNRTLADVISRVPDLSILSETLAQAGLMPLVESTQAPGAPGLTIFAPSDSAFEAMFQALQTNATNLLDSNYLKALLLHHVGLGEYTKSDLSRLSYTDIPTASPAAFNTLRAAAGSRVLYTTNQGPVLIRVIELDEPVYDPNSPTGFTTGTDGYRQFGAVNGVLHVINGVLAPLADVTASLANVPSFSTFYQALNATGLLEQLSAGCPNVTTANCPYNPITVWAPTNGAFQSLAMIMNMSVAELLDLPELEDILRFHITDPAHLTQPVLLAGLSENATMPTLYGENITVGTNMTFVPASWDPLLGVLYTQSEELVLESYAPEAASFAAPLSVRAYNGIIHGIDGVLLPYPLSEAGPEYAAGQPGAPAAEPPNQY